MYNQSELREIVNKTLVNISYNSEAPRLIDPVRYIISMGGKRIRPVITLMACNLFNDKIDNAVFPAAGLEIFHNFTLVHDDIMDQAAVRRGFETVHSKWSINQAIISGDVMAFIANECFMLAPAHLVMNVFKVFNKAAIEVCVGQQMDIDYEKAAIVSQEEYLRMIELKTASLLAASVRIGALIGGANEKDTGLLYDFGKNIGVAFQIQDDLLDIWGDTKMFGKSKGGDITANKKTFPLIKAFETASGEVKKQLHLLFSGTETIDPEEKIRQVTEIYDQLKIREITENLAEDYIDKAFQILHQVSIGEERKKEISKLASSLIGRRS